MFESKNTLPIIILAITMILSSASQTRQILIDRAALMNNVAGQEQPLKQSRDVAMQFEKIAIGTAKLAVEGNASAKDIVADLKKLGLTVDANAKPGERGITFTPPQQQQQQQAPAEGAAPAAEKPAASKPVETSTRG